MSGGDLIVICLHFMVPFRYNDRVMMSIHKENYACIIQLDKPWLHPKSEITSDMLPITQFTISLYRNKRILCGFKYWTSEICFGILLLTFETRFYIPVFRYIAKPFKLHSTDSVNALTWLYNEFPGYAYCIFVENKHALVKKKSIYSYMVIDFALNEHISK